MNTGSLLFFANTLPSNFNNKLSCYFNFENKNQIQYISNNLGKDKNIITGYIYPTPNAEKDLRFIKKLEGQTNSTIVANFGRRVVINSSGNIAVMSSRFDGQRDIMGDIGSAMIFSKNNNNEWNFLQKITGGLPAVSFGDSLSMNNDGSLIVMGGASWYPTNPVNPNLNNVGAPRIFSGNPINGWTFKAIITGDLNGNGYGTSVHNSSNGDIIIMGGPGFTALNSTGLGALMVFTGNSNIGWRFRQRLTGNISFSLFGENAKINDNGNIISVGSPGLASIFNPSFIYRTGQIEIFTGNSNLGWSSRQKINGNHITDLFGSAIAINNNSSVIVVGSPLYGFNGNPSGLVSIFTGNSINGWILKQLISGYPSKINQFGLIEHDNFGSSVSISKNGNQILVSHDLNGGSGGKVSIFTGNANESWRFVKTILKPEVGFGSLEPFGYSFGSSLDSNIDGETIIVGQLNDFGTGLYPYTFGGVQDEITSINYGSASIFSKKNTLDFWTKKENTALLSGNYIKLENFKNSSINLRNFTYITSFEKLNLDGGVLLSCIKKSTGLFTDINKNLVNKEYFEGFEFGLTSNNYLYFEYFKNDGPAVCINKNKINDKSAVYLSINSDDVNFGFFDFLNDQTVNQNFRIDNNYLFNPDNLYIGYNPEAENLYTNNKNFVGLIDDIIFTSPNLFNYEMNLLSSGFIYDFKSAGQFISSFTISGTTGTYQALTGYRTEITGWETIETGTITDEWGFTVMGYADQPLITQIPLSGTFNLSGEILVVTTGFSGTEYNLNNNKYLSYQKNIINFLNKIDNQDLIESRFLTGYDNLQLNKKNIFIPYERYGDFYKKTLNTSFYNLFANGQLQRSGSTLKVTSPYSNTNDLIIENDFSINKDGNIIFNNFYGLQGESSVFIDSTLAQNIYLGEASNTELFTIDSPNVDLFLNGQKLTEGLHYNIADNSYGLKYSLTGISQFIKYGTNLATNEDLTVIAVGAPADNYGAEGIGHVFLYTGHPNNGWNLKQIFSGNEIFDLFGTSVSISNNGNILMISAPFDSNINNFAAGNVFVYTGNSVIGWTLKETFMGSGQNEGFGVNSVMNRDGSILIASSPYQYESSGLISIYTGNPILGWNIKQNLIGTGAFSRFGQNLSLNKEGTVLMTIADDDDPEFLSLTKRTVHIFTGDQFSNWSLTHKLSNSTTNQSQFGFSMLSNDSGTMLVIGAQFENYPNRPNAGSVFIYTGNPISKWQLTQRLSGSKPNANLGYSLNLTNNDKSLIVGAPNNIFIPGGGNILVFTDNLISGWQLQHSISDDSSNNSLGVSVNSSQNGKVLIAGNPIILAPGDPIPTEGSSIDKVLIYYLANTVYLNKPFINYELTQKLSGDGEPNNFGENFGDSISMTEDGGIIVVGARGDKSFGLSAGGAFIFTGNSQNGWRLTQKLTGDSQGDLFGVSCAISPSGNTIVVGDYWDEPNGTLQDAGSASIFTGNSKDGWNFVQKITGDQRDAAYGSSVDINSDSSVIVMGGPASSRGTVQRAGAALVYIKNINNQWELRQKLTGIAQNFANFGDSVTINDSGNIIAVGSPSEEINGVIIDGSVSIFTGNKSNGWIFRQKLTGDVGTDTIGKSLSFADNGNIIIAGASSDNEASTLGGASFIYTGNSNIGWRLRQKLIGYSNENNSLGTSVASNYSGTVIAMGGVGSYLNTSSGSVIVFTGNVQNGWVPHQKFSGENAGDQFGNKLAMSKNSNIMAVGAWLRGNPISNGTVYMYRHNDFLQKVFSGSLIASPQNFDSKQIKFGTPIITTENHFYSKNSEIYVNGVRQSLNFDYLELSKQDVTTGIKILLENNDDYIYNNEGFIR